MICTVVITRRLSFVSKKYRFDETLCLWNQVNCKSSGFCMNLGKPKVTVFPTANDKNDRNKINRSHLIYLVFRLCLVDKVKDCGMSAPRFYFL